MKILFVVPYAPTPIRVRPYFFIRTLAEAGHDVTVGTVWSGGEEEAAVRGLERLGVRTVIAEPLPAWQSARNCLAALPGREPLQAHYSWSAPLARRLAGLVAEGGFDAIHVEHLRGARYALLLAAAARQGGGKPAPVVWDSVDCISTLLRHARAACPLRRVRLTAAFELPRTERYEARLAGAFDRVLVTAERDREDLEALARRRANGQPSRRAAPIAVVPPGVDLGHFTPVPGPRAALRVVVAGKMSYHANATAVMWLVSEVMPRVWSVLPETRLWVVGKDPPPEVRRLGVPWPQGAASGPAGGPAAAGDARVLISGTVPDVRPFLQRAALAVAPLRYAVGAQNKVLEALACGTPVAATGQAAAGLGAGPGDGLVVASDPEGLAAAISALLTDENRLAQLGRAGRAYVERCHDWRAAGERLVEIYRDAAA